jgi:hypothetical protein
MTVIFVHAPQLLVSSLSIIAPTSFGVLLSAHARIEKVPALANVYDCEVIAEEPAPSVAMVDDARLVMVPPPFADDATCIKLSDDVPVEALPLLVIEAEKIVEEPTPVVTGEILPAMRSGFGTSAHDTLVGALNAVPLHE